MDQRNQWDWDTGKRVLGNIDEWEKKYSKAMDPVASHDGEKFAAVVPIGDMAFGVCENGETWESGYDKVWHLAYGPDARLTGLVSDTGMWTVATDGTAWEDTYEFAWEPRVSQDGKHIAAGIQQATQYGMVLDGTAWESLFAGMTDMTMSLDGSSTAAVVQTVTFSEGDIFTFQKGCYSVAVNGTPWAHNYVNVWTPAFSSDGKHVAAPVRTSLYDYTIAVDGKPWEARWPSVWEPVFSPKTGAVTAPVKTPKGWALAETAGKPIWHRGFIQLWHHQYSPDGNRIAAIVAPRFGKWTVAVDGTPWRCTFGDLVDDLTFSPDGQRVACVGKDSGKWTVVVDAAPWQDTYDMAYRPVFSPDGGNVAARVVKNGQNAICVNGRTLAAKWTGLWDPVFSPDGGKLLVRGIETSSGRKFVRHVLSVTDL